MARSRILRLCAVALWAFCLLAATAGQPAGSRQPVADSAPPAAATIISAVSDAAVLPPRVVDELRLSTSGASLRILVLAVLVALLVALPGLARRTSSARGRDEQPLRCRRFAIALRAPPPRFA